MRSPTQISAELEMKLARVEHWERFGRVPSQSEIAGHIENAGFRHGGEQA